jgi:hypothetical protein
MNVISFLGSFIPIAMKILFFKKRIFIAIGARNMVTCVNIGKNPKKFSISINFVFKARFKITKRSYSITHHFSIEIK